MELFKDIESFTHKYSKKLADALDGLVEKATK
jgi:hypothetical protein